MTAKMRMLLPVGSVSLCLSSIETETGDNDPADQPPLLRNLFRGVGTFFPAVFPTVSLICRIVAIMKRSGLHCRVWGVQYLNLSVCQSVLISHQETKGTTRCRLKGRVLLKSSALTCRVYMLPGTSWEIGITLIPFNSFKIF